MPSPVFTYVADSFPDRPLMSVPLDHPGLRGHLLAAAAQINYRAGNRKCDPDTPSAITDDNSAASARGELCLSGDPAASCTRWQPARLRRLRANTQRCHGALPHASSGG